MENKMILVFFANPEMAGQVGILTDLVFPILGILIIILCVSSFFFPFGQRFKEGKQVIRGFGLDLEISVLTLLLLIGFVMTFTGVFLHFSGREVAELKQDKRQLEGKLEELRDRLERAGRFTVIADLILPENVNLSALQVGNLECRFILFDNSEHAVAVSRGLAGNSLRVTLADFQRGDVIAHLELREHGTERVIGVANNVYPLQPLLKLESPH